MSNNVFWSFKQLEKNLKKVAERSRDSGRRSRDRRPKTTVRFKRFGKILKKVAEHTRQWLRSRDRWLSNNVFWTKLYKKIKKSLNGLVGGHATVGRLSQRFYRRFKQFVFWKKSLNGHTVGHATRPTVKNDFSRFKQLDIFLIKVAERSATVVEVSDRRPTVKQRFLDPIRKNFEKSRRTVTRQWLRSCDRRPTVIFWTFKQLFEKSRWTVGRRSRDRRPTQTTIFRRFKQFDICWKKCWTVTYSGRRSRDCRPTVKQRFFDVASN